MVSDWVTIIPAAGDVKSTAQALLGFARDPHDVRTRGTGTEFLVAPYVADLYNAPRRRRTKKGEGEE